jgi:hypothetical protein
VVVTELAEVSVAYFLGELMAMAIIPIVGAILLIVGLRQRSRARQFPPGYPPPGPFPPGAPAPPAPPEYYPSPYPAPRPQRSSVALIVIGSLILAFGLLGILSSAADLAPRHGDPALSLIGDPPRSVKVGQCIGQSNFLANNMAPTPQDCHQSDSLLEVATAGGGSSRCPDGKLRDSQYSVLFDKNTTLCFLLNLKQGQCYSVGGTPESPTFATAPCDGSVPVVQVVRRVDGESDRTLCPTESDAVSYPAPARLYCLQPLKS